MAASSNEEEMRRKRQESRTSFLQRQTELKTRASDTALQQQLAAIRGGGAPTSLAAIDVVQRRVDAVRLAQELRSVALDRASAAASAGGPDAKAERARDGGASAWASADAVDDQLQAAVSAASAVASTTSTASASAAAGPRFVPLDAAALRERVARHDFQAPKSEDDISAERAAAVRAKRAAIEAQRRALPIFAVREELLRAVRANAVVVLVGETGCGKSTQTLQYLFEDGFTNAPEPEAESSGGNVGKALQPPPPTPPQRLICTQPRRIAATSVAERVAVEMGERLGGLVGYKVRFDDRTTRGATRILFVTDGLMLKEMAAEPDLSSVAAILVDEAHERSLASDVVMGLLRDVARSNTRLRIIVASATIEADKFCAFFGGAPVFRVSGNTFPVDVSYAAEPVADYVAASADTALMLHTTRPLPGDILIFLPGQDDIEQCCAAIRERAAALGGGIRELLVLPVYSALPPREQQRIYEAPPEGGRKVVVATNIAETSITIDGIVFVIDCGLCKQNFFNARTNMEELAVVRASQASADQRKGRAGRDAARRVPAPIHALHVHQRAAARDGAGDSARWAEQRRAAAQGAGHPRPPAVRLSSTRHRATRWCARWRSCTCWAPSRSAAC